MNWIAWAALAVGAIGLAGFALDWWGRALSYRQDEQDGKAGLVEDDE